MKAILHSYLDSKFVSFYLAYKKYSSVDLRSVSKRRCYKTYQLNDPLILEDLGKLNSCGDKTIYQFKAPTSKVEYIFELESVLTRMSWTDMACTSPTRGTAHCTRNHRISQQGEGIEPLKVSAAKNQRNKFVDVCMYVWTEPSMGRISLMNQS